MDWMEEVRENLKKRRQILFSKDAACLQPLAAQLAQQPHTVLVLWALAWAEETVDTLEARYPQERRPREALEAARAWAAGALKMRPAQRAILNCHALAKELTRKEDIARCHGVGQACSVVHTPGHGLGYPLYDLTALVHQWGLEECREAVEARLRAYETTLRPGATGPRPTPAPGPPSSRSGKKAPGRAGPPGGGAQWPRCFSRRFCWRKANCRAAWSARCWRARAFRASALVSRWAWRARWALVPRAGVSSCFWMARWRRLGLGRGRTAVSAGRGGLKVRSLQWRWRKA